MANVERTHRSFYFNDGTEGSDHNLENARKVTHELSVGQYATHTGSPYVSFEGELYPYGQYNPSGTMNAPETCYQFTLNMDDFSAYVDELVALRDNLKG